MNLRDIVDKFPLNGPKSNLLMRESIRIKRRKTIRESRAPQTGAYWWVPQMVDGKPKWEIVEYFDADYNDNTLHMEMWDHVLELIAIQWQKDPRILIKYLGNHYSGLPRGRVGERMINRDGKSIKGWVVAHGDDSPVQNGERVILRHFNLSGAAMDNRVEFMFDEHEQMDSSDCKRVQAVLGNLGLKGVVPKW